MAPHLGCIADDFTGATDLANNLVRAGMRVVLYIGVPADVLAATESDAIVVALKSRTARPSVAVAESLDACRWLLAQGVRQVYFKICSTFDSTPLGNIGPVLEALMAELRCDFSVVTPAFPENERTVFLGHLFVGKTLLSESGMRDHPLTPMSDSHLVRVLGRQLHHRRVGLLDFRTIATSAKAIEERIGTLKSEGITVAIADSIGDADLARLGDALKDHKLVTASSGLAMSLPQHWGFRPSHSASSLPVASGRGATIAGSCSSATNAQVGWVLDRGDPAYALDPLLLAADADLQVQLALDWAEAIWRKDTEATPLLYTTAGPDQVVRVHAKLGGSTAGAVIEGALGALAAGLVAGGVRRLIVAGGETSGTCVQRLGIRDMLIGPQIAPGIPWCYSPAIGGRRDGLHLVLKSGNFGSVDFFSHAFTLLSGETR